MNKSRILLLLQRPIAFHRVFVPLGGVTGAVLLSQMLYWSNKGESEWIYKTQADWYAETGLTRTEQETARKQLRKSGVLLEKHAGIPSRLFFSIDFEALGAYLESQSNCAEASSSNGSATMQESRIVECGKPANKEAGNPQTSVQGSCNLKHRVHRDYTETTAEAAQVPAPQVEQLSAAAAASDDQIKTVQQVGGIVESPEDRLVFAELIQTFSVEKVIEAIKTVRSQDHRRAYSSNVAKRLTASKAQQESAARIQTASSIVIDAAAKHRGDEIMQRIKQKRTAQ
jgi:hypothetical protein